MISEKTVKNTSVTPIGLYVRLLAFIGLIAASALAQANITDGFDRPDGGAIGNGWIEKTPSAFTVVGGEVVKQPTSTGYHDNIVYRPSSEDVLDVEASIEFSLTNASPGYPQIFVRVQSGTVGTGGSLDGYILYIADNNSQARLGRQLGSSFETTLASIFFTQSLNTTDRFRLRLRAEGTSPVVLNAYVERLNGALWEIIGQTVFNDSSADRIVAAGSVGFSGYVEGGYRFDNFERTNLSSGPVNPAPVLNAINPTSVVEGSSAFSLTVTGSDFLPGSVVRWNGADRTTTFVSATELQAAITGVDVAAAGTADVTVLNPSPGGGVSAAQTFSIGFAPGGSNPDPVLNTVSPQAVQSGGAGFILTASGIGFAEASVVRWNGVDLPTTYISSFELQANVTAADISTAGVAAVTVFSPAPGGGVSAPDNVLILNPGESFFTENFNRTNAADLGNNWTEKTPGVFSIVDSTVVSDPAFYEYEYHDSIVHRPLSEDLQDLETAVEFVRRPANERFPQIHARIQRSTIDVFRNLHSYLLFVDSFASPPGRAIIAINPPGNSVYECYMFEFPLPTALQDGERYRLRFRVTGTDPVVLTGFVEQLVNGAWNVMASGTTTHDINTVDPGIYCYPGAMPPPITSAGSMGFAKFREPSEYYDNFYWRSLTALPFVDSLNPSSVGAGSGNFNLTVNGNNFTAGSVVRWNGADRPTTFVSATELSAAINAADIATQGTASVAVYDPAGGASNAQTLTIQQGNNPAPATTGINPIAAVAGSGAFNLTVNGSGFIPGSVVRWNGADRTTTFVSVTQLQAAVTAADVIAAGTADVTVFNVAPGGGESAVQTFTITQPDNPVPTLTGFNPSAVSAGASSFTLTLAGNGFVANSVVRWNGADRITVYVSATELQALILDTDVATQGTAQVTVFNPAPVGGLSAGQTFTINEPSTGNPSPILSGINPNSVSEGSSAFSLTVTGSDFIAGSIVRWNGSARTTTFVSGTELQAAITAADVATAGSANVTVFNPTPDGGSSAAIGLTVTSNSGGFVDAFTVPDGGPIGNGWIEKNPAAFTMVGGEVVKQPTSSGYHDNIVYRPSSEDVLDVEASVELQLTGSSPGYPQLFTRIQSGTVGNSGSLDGYILYIADNNFQARLGRQLGSGFETTLASIFFTQSLNTTDRFRLRMRVEGTNPVVLNAYVERLNGAVWDIIGQTVFNDSSASRIATAGSVGFSGYVEGGYRYDNFERTNLSSGPVNPAPVLNAINPTSVVEGSSAFSLTVTGSDFLPGSVVRWNGADRTTTFVSATELQAAITGADVAAAGTADVTVLNPSPGGGPSAVQIFTIDPPVGSNPAPGLANVTPNAASAGQSAFSLTVNGSGFIPGSVVRWNGADRITTFISATQLAAAITAADVASAGVFNVTVFNPAPGGGTSAAGTVTVTSNSGGFVDGFNIPDGGTLGNGWIEKNPAAFTVAGGDVVKQATSTGYHDNIVYRPSNEDLLDVEASIEFQLTNATPGYPQLFVRVQSATAATAGVLDGYILYISNDTARARLGRQLGNSFETTLAELFLTQSLNTTDRYRLRMSAQGTNPVVISGYIERNNGGAWDIIGQAVVNDNSASRIATAGSVGFSGYVEATYRYDNFARNPLP